MENKLQYRSSSFDFETREDGDNPVIEGYFSVFNTNYDMGFEMSESIAPGAFTNSLSNDVRALINHDTTLVLGRTSAHTLELREDSRGLWGKITINPKDSDAMNLYPWRMKWQPTPVFLPGKSHGQRSLVGYIPWGRKELDTTERLHFHFHPLY